MICVIVPELPTRPSVRQTEATAGVKRQTLCLKRKTRALCALLAADEPKTQTFDGGLVRISVSARKRAAL